MRVVNEFTPQFYNRILEQRKAGEICSTCHRTQIEHIFEPRFACSHYSPTGGLNTPGTNPQEPSCQNKS